MYCIVLQCAAVCCSVLQCAAVCCSVLQCAAVCCSVLQCVKKNGIAIHPSLLSFIHVKTMPDNSLRVCCSVLCAVVWCNVLQCAAVCCSVLQYVEDRGSAIRPKSAVVYKRDNDALMLPCVRVAVCCSVL